MSDSLRARAYSHTRTNSSSSASSGPSSPPPSSDFGLPYPPYHRSPGSRTDNSSDTSSVTSQSNQYSTSEAAAAAALKNVKNVQITSANRLRPLPEDGADYSNTSVLAPASSNKSGSLSGQSGNKLSNVAATAAAFASRPKGGMFNRQKARQQNHSSGTNSSNSTGLKLGSLGSSSSTGGFGLSKKKATDLTIQTSIPLPSRPSLSERSPLSRPSKELERIASIASLSTAAQDPEKHKHHISFLTRKETYGNVLSSSSSNSKLISEQGSIYSFNPSSPGISMLEMKNVGTKEDQDQITEGTWALLCNRVTPLFSGEELRIPIEDLNSLVRMHLQFLVQRGGVAKDIISELQIFLRMGMCTMDLSGNGLYGADLLVSLVENWSHFFTKIYPYLQAVFLPLQMEFEGHGKVLTGSISQEFWGMLLERNDNLSTKRFILIAYRDNIVVPIISQLEIALSQIYLHTGHDISGPDLAVRVMQCANVLASIQSRDENQACIERLVSTLKSNWLSGSRGVKDRRGFVPQKVSAGNS